MAIDYIKVKILQNETTLQQKLELCVNYRPVYFLDEPLIRLYFRRNTLGKRIN